MWNGQTIELVKKNYWTSFLLEWDTNYSVYIWQAIPSPPTCFEWNLAAKKYNFEATPKNYLKQPKNEFHKRLILNLGHSNTPHQRTLNYFFRGSMTCQRSDMIESAIQENAFVVVHVVKLSNPVKLETSHSVILSP